MSSDVSIPFHYIIIFLLKMYICVCNKLKIRLPIFHVIQYKLGLNPKFCMTNTKEIAIRGTHQPKLFKGVNRAMNLFRGSNGQNEFFKGVK
jgi:hypothetical protein